VGKVAPRKNDFDRHFLEAVSKEKIS